MTTITVQIDDSKAALLREKADKYNLSMDQFVSASIEDLLSQPEPEFEKERWRKHLAELVRYYRGRARAALLFGWGVGSGYEPERSTDKQYRQRLRDIDRRVKERANA